MKKFVFSLLMAVVVFACLTACGVPSPPNEKEIARDLPIDLTTVIIENPFNAANTDVYEMDIEEVSIEKRQTNEKDDIVFCLVKLENDYYRFIKHLTLSYSYYDQGGWIFEGYSQYAPTEWEVLKVPFGSEDILPTLDYCASGPGTMTSHLQKGSIEYSFPIEEVHNNGSYTGTVVVECQFDGQKWTCEKNTDDVQFIWDIVGTWEYRRIEENPYSYSCNEIVVTIESFDQASAYMNGTWYMNSEYSTLRSYSEKLIFLDDEEQVRIVMGTKGASIELGDEPGKNVMHSYVEFHPDKVVACYATHFSPVQLDRQNDISNPDSGVTAYETNYDSDDVDAWEQLIEEYFAAVETGDQKIIEDFFESSGVAVDDMDSYWGTEVIDFIIDEIECTEDFYAEIKEKMADAAELNEREYEYLTAHFDNCAQICVVADLPVFGYVSYDFFFTSWDGLWKLWYIQ